MDNRPVGYTWLHGCLLVPAQLLGISKGSRIYLASMAMLSAGNKAHQWLVRQLVKCLIPKSGFWTPLWCCCAFTLPSAHWEPHLCNWESEVFHRRASSTYAQRTVPSLPAALHSRVGYGYIFARKWAEKSNQERVRSQSPLLIPAELFKTGKEERSWNGATRSRRWCIFKMTGVSRDVCMSTAFSFPQSMHYNIP